MIKQNFIQFIGIVFLVLTIILPIQYSFAESYEDQIRHALFWVGEEVALKIAYTIGYDFSKNYFDNFVDISSKNLTFEHILLTVIINFSVHQYSDILIENPFLRQFEIEKTSQQLEKEKEKIRNEYQILGTYDVEAWKVIESNSKRIIVAKYTNETNVDALYQTRSLDEEAAIMILQTAPAYSENGELVTLDYYTKKLVQDIPVLENTDIEKEPIRAGVLLATEPDYTMQAKLIKTKDGHVISLEEAMLYEYKIEEVRKAQQYLKILDDVMELKKVDHPDKKAQQFKDLIQKINNEKEYLRG